MKYKKLSLPFLLLLVALTVKATITTTALRIEGLDNPVGIDAEQPRFSWRIEATTEKGVIQTAYQIVVASSLDKLEKGEGDVWNSGKVSSDASLWIPYKGKQLKTNNRYYWKVKVWTNKGEAAWSAPARWSMGLLSENDWKAQWIGMERLAPWDSGTQWSRLSSRYLRKEFPAKKQIKYATAHISGMGLYELYIKE